MKKIYVLVGPPGAGKGTQAEFLRKHLNAKLIQPGVYLRQQIADQTEIGKQIRPILAKGNLVPDSIVNEMIFDKISRTKKDIILDGFPRGLSQAQTFHQYVEQQKLKVFLVEIKLTDESVFTRITGRRSCTCGETYHIKFNPPKQKDICNKCGKKLFLREDSKKSVVKQRLHVYYQQTTPVLKYLKKFKQYKYIAIDGEKAISDLNNEILSKLK